MSERTPLTGEAASAMSEALPVTGERTPLTGEVPPVMSEVPPVMRIFRGLSGSHGCAAGEAVIIAPAELDVTRRGIEDPAAEIEALEAARERYAASLTALAAKAEGDGDEVGAAISRAYLEILDDPVFFEDVRELIRQDKVCAAFAIEQKRRETAALFEAITDEYLRQRGDDINNACWELIREIRGGERGDPFAGLTGRDLIVFARDLAPTDTVRLDKSRLRGIVTEAGGVTSHTVILAKSLAIPAVVGIEGISRDVTPGAPAFVDGQAGEVILWPDEAAQKDFAARRQADEDRGRLYQANIRQKAVTADGTPARINVNIGDKDSVAALDSEICDGVGLFRTEFLYMDLTDYPDEETQYQIYRQAALRLAGKEVIIRTLDIVGDKQMGYMDLPRELNPFLGYRAIRLCLDRPLMFKTQLRAILRAAVHGDVKVMFPMIVTLEELLRAKALLAEAGDELAARGAEFRRDIPVGIMIETPAAAMISDQLAKYADFFSIGTNDLIQYTTASDRMNQQVQYLYDWCNIAVLRLIRLVCENGEKQGIEVGICGETASEPALIPLWIGMGVAELSVAPALLGRTKYIARNSLAGLARARLPEILALGEIGAAREALAQLGRDTEAALKGRRGAD